MNWITNGVDEERVISTLQNELESLRTQMAQEMELGNSEVEKISKEGDELDQTILELEHKVKTLNNNGMDISTYSYSDIDDIVGLNESDLKNKSKKELLNDIKLIEEERVSYAQNIEDKVRDREDAIDSLEKTVLLQKQTIMELEDKIAQSKTIEKSVSRVNEVENECDKMSEKLIDSRRKVKELSQELAEVSYVVEESRKKALAHVKSQEDRLKEVNIKKIKFDEEFKSMKHYTQEILFSMAKDLLNFLSMDESLEIISSFVKQVHSLQEKEEVLSEHLVIRMQKKQEICAKFDEMMQKKLKSDDIFKRFSDVACKFEPSAALNSDDDSDDDDDDDSDDDDEHGNNDESMDEDDEGGHNNRKKIIKRRSSSLSMNEDKASNMVIEAVDTLQNLLDALRQVEDKIMTRLDILNEYDNDDLTIADTVSLNTACIKVFKHQSEAESLVSDYLNSKNPSQDDNKELMKLEVALEEKEAKIVILKNAHAAQKEKIDSLLLSIEKNQQEQ